MMKKWKSFILISHHILNLRFRQNRNFEREKLHFLFYSHWKCIFLLTFLKNCGDLVSSVATQTNNSSFSETILLKLKLHIRFQSKPYSLFHTFLWMIAIVDCFFGFISVIFGLCVWTVCTLYTYMKFENMWPEHTSYVCCNDILSFNESTSNNIERIDAIENTNGN